MPRPAIIRRHDPIALRDQRRDQVPPFLPGLRKAVQENRGALVLARPDIMQSQAGLDLRHAVLDDVPICFDAMSTLR